MSKADSSDVTVTVKSGTGARRYRVRRFGWNTLADLAGRAETRRRPPVRSELRALEC
jgi:hypothetical protein